MALSQDQVVDTALGVLEHREAETARLEHIAKYMRGDHTTVYVPPGANREYRWLVERSRVNIMPLPVTVVAQALYVEGYRPAKKDTNAAPWNIWQANRMDARQHGLHRAALQYGVGYVVVMPGDPVPVIRPVSPRRLTAVYADPIDDEWPLYAVEETVEQTTGGKRRVVRLYDDMSRFTLVGKLDEPDLHLETVEEHGLGVCPVVRYLNSSDLDDGCAQGAVEPLIVLQDQLNATTFNLLMAQQYSAFRQRWVSGMAPPLDEDGNPIAPFRARVDALWNAESPDTKFGEFSQTDLGGYLESRESTIRYIATVSQTPPHHLLGQMVNLSAEALAAAESGLQRKITERKSTFGEAHEQTLRLAGLAAGDMAAWGDTAAQIVWRDTEARSLAQTVDALGKLTQMLGVPAEELWERVPGVTQTDVDRWKAALARQDPLDRLDAQFTKQLQQTPGAGRDEESPSGDDASSPG